MYARTIFINELQTLIFTVKRVPFWCIGCLRTGGRGAGLERRTKSGNAGHYAAIRSMLCGIEIERYKFCFNRSLP